MFKIMAAETQRLLHRCILYGTFRVRHGRLTSYYVDLRRLARLRMVWFYSVVNAARQLAEAMVIRRWTQSDYLVSHPRQNAELLISLRIFHPYSHCVVGRMSNRIRTKERHSIFVSWHLRVLKESHGFHLSTPIRIHWVTIFFSPS